MVLLLQIYLLIYELIIINTKTSHFLFFLIFEDFLVLIINFILFKSFIFFYFILLGKTNLLIDLIKLFFVIFGEVR